MLEVLKQPGGNSQAIGPGKVQQSAIIIFSNQICKIHPPPQKKEQKKM